MEEITSKMVDGVKVWQVPRKLLAEGSEIFSAKLKAIYDKAIEEGIKRTGNKNFKLSSKEISALRNHKDLGMWFSGNKPLAVDSVNSFLTKTPIGAKKVVLKKVLLKIPKDTANTFGRKFFENIDNAPREFTDWLDRLEGVSKKGTFWPKGMSFKGFKKYIAQEGYKNTLDLNKALKAKLGFDFDVGHLWGALGAKGERTLVGPLGARSEGKFSPQNVAPQPRSLKLEQLLDPKWNVIEPNVPPFFSKAGYQVAGAQELLDVYGGGQGWSASLGDYLMSKSPNIEKLSNLGPEAVAYVSFADPTRGDFIGKTPEARYAQMFDPDIREDVWRQTAELAETAEAQSGPVRILQKAKKPLLQADLTRRLVGGAGRALASPVVGGEQMHALGSYAKTGDAVHLKDFGVATAKDVAYGAGFTTAAKVVAQRQLTRGLIKQGLVRGALGAVSGPVGWGLLAYTAYDTANQFTKAYTGTSINQRIGNLFINRPDDSITRVALGQF